MQGLHQLLLGVAEQRGLEHGAAVGPQRLEELVRGGLAHDDQQGRGPRLDQVLDALLEVVLDAEVTGGAQGGAHDPAGHAGQRGEREQEQQPDQRAPEQAAEAAPGGLVVDGGRDVQLSLLVAADDGRVLQVDQVVVLQLDELGPYVLGRGLVRVTDDDQVTHRGCLLTRHQGVTTRWFSTLATPGAAAAADLAALASLIERTCP
jgi:hypothetical protein